MKCLSHSHRSYNGFLVLCLWVTAIIECSSSVKSNWLEELSLPPEIASYVVKGSPILAEKCVNDRKCPFKKELISKKCWGYEDGCDFDDSYSADKLSCPNQSTWPNAKKKLDQRSLFYRQGDFGHVKERLMDMRPICTSTSQFQEGSSIVCSDHLRYCYVRNIFFDFKSLKARTSSRYREDVIHEGEVGGRCDQFDKKLLLDRSDHKSYLQSWAHELAHFESLPNFSVSKENCDVIFDRPTVIIKLDAAVNMFHHFCDFVNLYASQHINGSFSKDIDILWWDTYWGGFVDAMFGATWEAFSDRKPVELISLDGKKVCFRDAMLPLLARQRLGLYYNMPVVDGCFGSGLFHAFSHHVLHRLGVVQEGPIKDQLRVTLLSRSTKFRRILNENELIEAMESLPGVQVKRVDYNARMPFIEQLKLTQNSDIFIGMHGSGLTHLLFLPDWAAIFELYNCEDERCYWDLSRLRGVKYWTWQKEGKVYADGEGRHPTLGTPHKKFANYSFDVEEFIRLVKQMIEYVRRHPKFVKEQRRLRRLAADEL